MKYQLALFVLSILCNRAASATVDPVSQEDSVPEPQGKCGIDRSKSREGRGRIMGGESARLGEFPWMALLEYSKNGGNITYQCCGSLVNKRYVLTAAHCVIGEIEEIYGSLVSVRLGEHDISREKDCVNGECADPPQEIAVAGTYPHPGFNDDKINREDDIALIRLAQRAKYSDFVQPICLAEPNSRVESDAALFISGWGTTLTAKISNVKQKLRVKVFDKKECSKKFARAGARLTDKQLCAGGKFQEDACRRDSGGPLMWEQPNGSWETVGVVSFGNGCGNPDWPGVYTSVASYLDWIKETIRSTNV